MARIKFTSALKAFFPSLTDLELEGNTIRDLITQIDMRYPGLCSYLTDDNGSLRQHVNIFLQGNLIRDRTTLTDSVRKSDELLIFQALSGG